MKLTFFITLTIFLGLALQSNASSISTFKVTCDAALAGDQSKGEPEVRTKIQMTFCGIEMSGMMIPAEGEGFGRFWYDENFAICGDQNVPGVSFSATRYDGSTYSGFIPSTDSNKPVSEEETSTYTIGSTDGEYFEYTSQEEAPSLVTLVKQGNSGFLTYNFKLASCYHQYSDFDGSIRPY